MLTKSNKVAVYWESPNKHIHALGGQSAGLADVEASDIVLVWAKLVALQAGKSRVRFPMVSVEFFIDIILSVALWPMGRLNLLTEMSTRNISWGVKAAGA
jgi:hypothetical protein